MKLPAVYPITDRRLSGLRHAEQVTRLAAGGATIVQLREKSLSPRDFFDQATEAIEIARDRGIKLIINDRVDIALAIGADGVHLGQDDLDPEYARRILGKSAIIGYSTHSVEQAIAAVRLPIDYIAIGPAFPTATKENPDAVVGTDGIAAVRTAIGSFPLVAIGGIDINNIAHVMSAGADSAAVISSVLVPASSIETNFAELQNTV